MPLELKPITIFKLIAIGLIVASCAIAIWCNPSGTGEYRKSPNDKFIAHASNMSRGTWWGSRIKYIDLRVEALATHQTLWQAEYQYSNPVGLPDYGSRQQHFITWAADSSAVTIPIGLDRQITLPLP